MTEQDAFLDFLKETISQLFTKIQQEVIKMAVSQTQFDPDLTQLGTDFTTLVSLVAQLITAYQAALTAAGTPDDLTNEDVAVKSMDSTAQTTIAQIQAALAAATPPAPAAK
jgi:hypothetical protein